LRLVTLPMGWTNSVPIFHEDVTYLLQPEIPEVTIPHREGILYKYYGNVEFYNVSIVVECMCSTKKNEKKNKTYFFEILDQFHDRCARAQDGPDLGLGISGPELVPSQSPSQKLFQD
jgi:hypothetical protein